MLLKKYLLISNILDVYFTVISDPALKKPSEAASGEYMESYME